MDALFVNNAALIVSGVACILLPFLTSYIGHVAFAVTFGLAIGEHDLHSTAKSSFEYKFLRLLKYDRIGALSSLTLS